MSGWNPTLRRVEECLGCEDFRYQEWPSTDGSVYRQLICNFIKVDVGPKYYRPATQEDVDSLPSERRKFETRTVPQGCERGAYGTVKRLREL